MMNFSQRLRRSIILLSSVVITSQLVWANDGNSRSVIEQIIAVVNSNGQESLCQKGGLLRENSGRICETNIEVATMALYLCAPSLEFQESDCAAKAIKTLKGMSVLQPYTYADNEIKDNARSSKANNPAIICQFDRDKLQGRAQALAAQYCQKQAQPWSKTQPNTSEQGNLEIGSHR